MDANMRTDDGSFDINDHDELKPDKKIRKRKKKLYQSIKSQMEFYFSDSNILKDKFLSNLLNNSEDGLIELEVFLRFNKIRALTNSLQDIASALLRSELLEVSEDGTRIKRTKPVIEKDDVDECTIYVEHLPSHADHNWLTTVFSAFGVVTYISLPRYKHTGKLKGFAFIEFDDVESARKACKHFGGLFNSPPQQIVDTVPLDENATKRKRESESEDENAKRSKTDNDEAVESSLVKTVEEESTLSTVDKKHKKKRKRKKKQKMDEEKKPLNLRVMTKIEWKRWRNKYLSLQKATTAQIKKSLLGEHFPTYRNFTPTRHQENAADQVEIEEPEKIVKTLEFQSGVVVHVQLDQPFSSLSDFKKQARTITNVAYIDAAEGDTTIYIRCEDSESAATYVKSTRSGLRGISRILNGEEEKTYWDKIQRDRENKFLSKTKQKKRGIEKLMTKAEKIVEKNRHIRFEED